jgi:hypothetical protein
MAYVAKTKPDSTRVDAFIAAVEPVRRRNEAIVMLDMMKRLTGEEPTLWGPSIVGFGSYDYKYESGHSGTSMRVGFSPARVR